LANISRLIYYLMVRLQAYQSGQAYTTLKTSYSSGDFFPGTKHSSLIWQRVEVLQLLGQLYTRGQSYKTFLSVMYRFS